MEENKKLGVALFVLILVCGVLFFTTLYYKTQATYYKDSYCLTTDVLDNAIDSINQCSEFLNNAQAEVTLPIIVKQPRLAECGTYE